MDMLKIHLRFYTCACFLLPLIWSTRDYVPRSRKYIMASSEADRVPLLFNQVYFYIILSPGLKGEEAENVSRNKYDCFLSLLTLLPLACKGSGGEWSHSGFPFSGS